MGKKHYFANCLGRYWTSAAGNELYEPHEWSKEYSSLEKAQEGAASHSQNNSGHRTTTQVVEEYDGTEVSEGEQSSGSEGESSSAMASTEPESSSEEKSTDET